LLDRVKRSSGAGTPSERWEAALKRMETTEELYRREVNDFCEWLSISLDELYQLGVEASKSDDPAERTIVIDKLTEYLAWVKSTKVSERSGKPYTYGKMKDIKAAVMKFFNVNGITYTTQRGSELAKLLRRTETDKRKLTRDEIRRLISKCPLRLKAAVALQKDTGLRVSDIAQIKYHHVKDGLLSQDHFGGFMLRTEKTDKMALPCFGPESVYYLSQWIEMLEKDTGKILSDEDYLFPVVRNWGNTKKGSKLKRNTLSELINNQLEGIGLKGQVSDNGIRYFFQSQLENKLNKNIILKLQGKTITDSSAHYSKHDIEELLPLYKEAYPVLMVEPGETVSLETIEKLREDNERLTKKMDDIENWLTQMVPMPGGGKSLSVRPEYLRTLREFKKIIGKDKQTE